MTRDDYDRFQKGSGIRDDDTPTLTNNQRLFVLLFSCSRQHVSMYSLLAFMD